MRCSPLTTQLQVNHDALNVWAPEHPKTVSWRAGAYFLGGLFSVVYGVYLANKTFYPYPDVVFREYPNVRLLTVLYTRSPPKKMGA